MTIQTEQNTLQVIHFLVQKVHLCFDIQYILKVIPLLELKTIPNAPHYYAGLMNLADKGIPVIDLALRLGLNCHEKYTLTTPIILCKDQDNEVGLVVDEILGLAMVDKNTLQMQNKFADPESLFSGVVTVETKLTLLLNMEKILITDLSMISIKNNHADVNLSGFRYE